MPAVRSGAAGRWTDSFESDPSVIYALDRDDRPVGIAARLRKLPLAPLLIQASRTDRILKGLAAGDAWSAITGLTGAMSGALQAGAESGRVSS